MPDNPIISGLPVMPSFLNDGQGQFCRKCKTWRHSSQFPGKRTTCDVCKSREKKSHAKYVKQRRVADVARIYGLTSDELLAMREAQGNLCAICGEPETRVTAKGLAIALSVDHSHATGKIRGLLCHRCNLIVASLEGASRAIVSDAYDYLARYE